MRSSRGDLRGPGPLARLALVVAGIAACRAPSDESRDATHGVAGRAADWLATRALACAVDAPAAVAGTATYYDLSGRGSCSFGGSEPSAPPDRMIAALSGADYAHAAWCGACLAVAGPRGEVVVRVVDLCPGCRRGDLDLGREAFAQIAPLSAGRTKVTWREVPCPVTGPVIYQVKPGSNPQWTAIQLRNHRHRIARLEARDVRGEYHAIARTDDNYFVAPGGLGPGPYALRVSDVHGHVLDDTAITLGAAAQPGAAQFPSCR
ncbi:MAG TPA: expansin EXLX1 family cellulose-binding protein [Kofleriaceae bacterium]|nr:expansin EXLX1 family cellulose-binding protein [Kofleriaceae bacterium]